MTEGLFKGLFKGRSNGSGGRAKEGSGFGKRARKLRIVAGCQLGILFLLLLGFGAFTIFVPDIMKLELFYESKAVVEEAEAVVGKTETAIEKLEARVKGTEVDLHGIAIDPMAGVVAVGDNGFVGISNERALVWIERRSNTRKAFNGVAWSADGETVIAAGDDGLIRVSVNGGETWGNPGNVTGKDINGVALSTDGRTAIVVGDGGLIRVSENGGETWSNPENVTAEDITGVALSRNGRVAVFVGDNGLIRVARGSDHLKLVERGIWEEEHPKERRRDFEAVAISADGDTAIAVGRDGLILRSIDAGRNWTLVDANVADDLNAIALSDDGGTAFAVGDDGTVLVSASGGAGWRSLDSRTAVSLRAVAFDADGGVVIIVGGNVVLRSTSPDGRFFSEIEGPRTPVIERIDTRESDPYPETEVSLEIGTSQETETSSQETGTSQETKIDVFYEHQAVRVMIIVLMLYFSRNLIVSMRYNRRLATHYDACQDAIQLSRSEELSGQDEGNVSSRQERIDQFKQLIHEILSPDDLDIGHSPRGKKGLTWASWESSSSVDPARGKSGRPGEEG